MRAVFNLRALETIIQVDKRALPHLLTIMEYVRKQNSLKKRRCLFFMNYEYTVLSENNHIDMQDKLNKFGRYGWKLVNVVRDNDNACLVTVMIRER